MPSAFDDRKAYAPQEEVFFDDGREEELVAFVTAKPGVKNSPAKVLEAIDEFARTKRYLMNVGEDKGKILTEIIQSTKPNVMVELGGYCGYSTILFADAMRGVGGKKYFCLERSPKFAHNIEVLVELAGLSGIIDVVVGPSNESIKSLHSSGKLDKIDMMFLDHYKPAYTTDLKLCESLGLIGSGTTLAADNVIKPGNPPYLKYVRSSVHDKRMSLTQAAEQDTKDFPRRSAKQYGDVEILSTEFTGNPNLIYESRLVESWEPSGVAVSFSTKTLRPALIKIQDAIEVTVCAGEEEV
ncbi:S-adenosyl-L-methionine-dependent methyltransferase [Cadophora sp. DSE1049]|nr:S-adenosyl-L-methionine-dependent methyltransferase [Cadophora sp. DSE1049]